MPSSLPSIAVIIPVHDGARTLGRALGSVLAQADVADLDVIVVDDGSRDDSAAIARETPGVRVLEQAQAGPAAARNAGIRAASADLLAFLDADDVWLPGKLRAQLDVLGDPAVDLVLTAFDNVADDGFELPAWARRTREPRAPEALPGFIFQAMLARRRAFDRVGLLDASMRWAEDTDWFLRARDAGLVTVQLEAVFVHRMIHDKNLSADVVQSHRGLVRAVHASVLRKRQGADR